MRKYVFIVVGIVLVTILAIVSSRRSKDDAAGVDGGDTPMASVVVGTSPSGRPGVVMHAADAGSYPHAVKDQAKRDDLRRRLLAAAAEQAAAAQAAGNANAGASATRGARETNDLAEFGKFIAQAIREDFIPMARECAKELASREPNVRGKALIAFELLGDPKIGGVVNDAKVVPASEDSKETTVDDERFETCVRESMYGVYFDPPPAGGMATLRFPVSITGDDGAIDEEVEDFHLKDRRRE